MKAYVLEEIGKLEYKETERPALKPEEVLVAVKYAGICGSDIPRIFETGTYSFPLIPGHEFSGTVVEAADKRNEEWLYKNVGIFPLIPCKECFSCQKQEYEMCRKYSYLGSRCDGGFAEYAAVPVWNLLEIPDKMSLKEAAMLEPAAVSLHAVRKLELTEGCTAAVFGLGTIGGIITQWLAYYGVKNVLATGHRKEAGDVMKQAADENYQYRLAQETDTAEWVLAETEGQGADIIIDCVGNSKSVMDALKSVRPGGQILEMANPAGDIFLNKNVYWQLLRKQVTLKGTWNSSFLHEQSDDWNTVIQACCEGKLKLSALITHELPLFELPKGLEIMRKKIEYRNKVMIKM